MTATATRLPPPANGSARAATSQHVRLPPQDQQAEYSVLGGCLRWNQALADVLPILGPDDFYQAAHQVIYRAMRDLYAQGQPVDSVTLANLLKLQGHLEATGGYVYLGQLWDHEPTGANVLYYARIVREHAICRALTHAGREIVREAMDPHGPAQEILEEAERKVFAVAQRGLEGSVVDLETSLNEMFDRLDVRSQRRGATGVLTGFRDLDDLTAGFQNGELAVLAARTSIGKSTLALNMVHHCLRRAEPVFLVSVEMNRSELMERLIASEAGVDGYRLRHARLTTEDTEAMRLARNRLLRGGGKLLHIDDTPSQSVLRIAANARRLKLRHGIKLVVVDYLQLIEPDNRRDPREQQVACMIRRLKVLAGDLGVPVLVLAQINREGEQGDRPRMRHIRECGAAEQDANTVLILHRSKEDDPVHEVYVDKQRNGPTGMVRLYFRKPYLRFEDAAWESDVEA